MTFALPFRTNQAVFLKGFDQTEEPDFIMSTKSRQDEASESRESRGLAVAPSQLFNNPAPIDPVGDPIPSGLWFPYCGPYPALFVSSGTMSQ